MFDELIENEKENIIEQTSKLIEFQSISEETNNSEYPFGKECSKALNYILELGKQMGFKTKNIDNYCGYIEFGEGEELVGIVGHLDVVPANIEDGWTTPPFSPSIRDEKLFGRGSIDDKGPVIASLYAMKVIKDTTKVSKRVRLIVGLNEEKNWKCINYYKKFEEWPSIGFSPDANFPAIYAEKGILTLQLANDFKIKNFDIIDINCNNNASNVVPKYCSITLSSHNSNIDKNFSNENSDLKITTLDKNLIKIEAFGIASHSAHPELGKNAIKILVEFLLNNFEFESDYLQTLYNLGVFEITSPHFLSPEKLEDESGILTSNVANLKYQNNELVIIINFRIPVNIKLNFIKEKYENINFENLKVSVLGHQEPLYVDKNSYLVKTLVDIFNKKTGLNEEAIAIGGGTYARAFKNFISYGVTMPNDLDMCHQVDEFVDINKLILASKIYAEAIYELAK